MMKKTLHALCLLFIICPAVILSGCSNSQQNPAAGKQIATPAVQREEADTLSNNYPNRYEGILPNPESPDVKTILCMSADYTRFRLAEKNTVGPAMTRITESGHMNTERGYGNDENATVYILNDDQAGKWQFIMVRRTGSDNLLLCDSSRKIIGQAFMLKKAH
jgi:hypothetical protein